MPPQQPTNKGLVIALIGVVIVAALIIWGLKSSKQPIETQQPGTTTPTAEWPSKAVKKQVITDKSNGADISAEYPETARADITAKLKSFVEDQIATFNKNNAGGLPPDSAASLTLDITYDEAPSSRADNYLFHIYSDTGGAHGIEVTRTFSFDAAGNQITLNSLFISKTNGLALVSNYVKQQLLKKQDADSKWISDGAAPTDENYQNFTVDNNGITVLFDPYQVAAYASGPQQVTVPLSVFKSEADPKLFK